MSVLLISIVLSVSALLRGADTADIVFVGDAMQHKSQLDAAHRPDGSYDYSEYFSEIRPRIQEADYAVVNLETPLGGAPYSGYPMFGAPDSYLDALLEAGFDFILAANNHALDRRDRGVRRTIGEFERRGVPHTGIWRSQAHRDSICPVIVCVNGFRIAMLNYTYSTNGIPIQGEILVDPIDTELIDADIARAREAGADLIAACMHWGIEYQLLPHASQRAMADRLVERGVDLVIGGHPHVIQPMELRRDVGGETGRNALVVYSLGNFISGMRTDDTRGGAAVSVRLVRDSIGRARVDSARYMLFFTEPPAHPGDNYRLIPADRPLPDRPDVDRMRRAFETRATDIFDRHNLNVGRLPLTEMGE